MPRSRPEPPLDPVKMLTWLVVVLLSLLMAKALWWLLTYMYSHLKTLAQLSATYLAEGDQLLMAT
ncbi:hypothetical protein [Fibrella forsythiae]|uniref:Uncharacterized protein n=1 Tax=Fibrella forsythiae TaxID=2817061 RepID=A0ABS3JMB8_9BACT|nr:hypothetical protein [Fibrella forsythiae]MBO0951157.1 hypothetical protein [Fibrella forsythiae]